MNYPKKILSLLLALAMLAGVMTALAEPAVNTDKVPLPQVGDVIHGFEAREIRDFALARSCISLSTCAPAQS